MCDSGDRTLVRCVTAGQDTSEMCDSGDRTLVRCVTVGTGH